MSLLTSPQTTREQHRFFDKIEKEYNRRSFINSNYIETPNPLQNSHENAYQFEIQLKDLMEKFLNDLKKLHENAKDSRIDYYFVLSQMKSYDFFGDISNTLNQNMALQHQKVLKENAKLKETIKKDHQEQRNNSQRKNPQKKEEKKFIFNTIKSVAQNLYEKAKVLTQEQFSELCSRVILQDKVVIKKTSDSDTYKKWDQRKAEKIEEKEMMARVDLFLQKKAKAENEEDLQVQLAKMVEDFRHLIQHKEQSFSCHRPCCTTQEQKIYPVTKASQLRRSSDSRRSHLIYKNDKTQEYFNRYYRKSEFDMHKILNVQRTKWQQMQKIQDDYRISIKQRSKLTRSYVK